jgi:hypothetical protein
MWGKATATAHKCGETLLKCVDCAAPVCAKCLVACPVGNRCGACAGSKPGDNIKAARNRISANKWKVIGGALFLGGMFGWVQSYVSFAFFRFIFWFVFMIAGRSAGQCLRRGGAERTEFYALSAFLCAEAGAFAVLCWLADIPFDQWAYPFIPFFMDAGIAGIGFLFGRCGFG